MVLYDVHRTYQCSTKLSKALQVNCEIFRSIQNDQQFHIKCTESLERLQKYQLNRYNRWQTFGTSMELPVVRIKYTEPTEVLQNCQWFRIKCSELSIVSCSIYGIFRRCTELSLSSYKIYRTFIGSTKLSVVL